MGCQQQHLRSFQFDVMHIISITSFGNFEPVHSTARLGFPALLTAAKLALRISRCDPTQPSKFLMMNPDERPGRKSEECSEHSDKRNPLESPGDLDRCADTDSISSNSTRLDEKSTPLLIPELLEQIVLHLPVTDVTRCKRLSKFWGNVINNSRMIKIHTFLEPVERFESVSYEHSPGGPWVAYISPTIRPLSEMEILVKPSENSYPIVSVHPALLSVAQSKFLYAEYDGNKQQMKNKIQTEWRTFTQMWVSVNALVKILALARARDDVFITQPPLRRIGNIAAEHRSEGITFRDLFRHISRNGGTISHCVILTLGNVVGEHTQYVQQARRSVEDRRSKPV